MDCQQQTPSKHKQRRDRIAEPYRRSSESCRNGSAAGELEHGEQGLDGAEKKEWRCFKEGYSLTDEIGRREGDRVS